MNQKFLGIDHLGVVVRDLDEACATWGETLGFDLTGSEELASRGLAVRFVDTGGNRIELIGATREDSEISGFLAKRGEGLHHVCVRVDDIEAALVGMRQRGARLINETPQPGAGGTRVAFVHPKATHGVLLELVEYPDGNDPHSS